MQHVRRRRRALSSSTPALHTGQVLQSWFNASHLEARRSGARERRARPRPACPAPGGCCAPVEAGPAEQVPAERHHRVAGQLQAHVALEAAFVCGRHARQRQDVLCSPPTARRAARRALSRRDARRRARPATPLAPHAPAGAEARTLRQTTGCEVLGSRLRGARGRQRCGDGAERQRLHGGSSRRGHGGHGGAAKGHTRGVPQVAPQAASAAAAPPAAAAAHASTSDGAGAHGCGRVAFCGVRARCHASPPRGRRASGHACA